MVLSGTALLLVLPALLLSATFLATVETGGEIASTQGLSDKIAFKAHDIKQTLRHRKEHGGRLDNKAFQEIAETFEESSMLGDVNIKYKYFDIRVEYNYVDIDDNPEDTWHATDNNCRVSNLKGGNWSYNFEVMASGDYDFNEPLLRLESLENGNWKITVAPTFTHGDATADVFWGNKLIFEDVNDGDYYERSHAGKGKWEGESKIVSGVPSSALVHISLEDPRGIVHYEETFPLRKTEEE